MESPFLPRVLGRYTLYGEIASGGMATVHFGRLHGSVGFARTVAIKRLHPQFAKDPGFVAMFVDEARLSSRIHHPNVVQTLDVVALERELFLVMEYVLGESFARLLRADPNERTNLSGVPLPIASAIVCNVLHGLHAAHEATSEEGNPLDLVHRDVSPHNILVGADGLGRVLDFGVAKASGRLQLTRGNGMKGTLSYMAPEQVEGRPVDRRTDVFAAGVVLWEALTQERLFGRDRDDETLEAVLYREIEPPSAIARGLPRVLDEVCMRALERAPAKRFPTAREMAHALEECAPVASASRVAEWVEAIAGDVIKERARRLVDIETRSSGRSAPVQVPTGGIPGPLPRPSAGTDSAEEPTVSVAVSPPAAAKPPSHRGRTRVVAGASVAAVLALTAIVTFMRATKDARPVAPQVSASSQLPPAHTASDVAPSSLPPAAAPVPTVTALTARPVSDHPPASKSSRILPPRKGGCSIGSYIDESGITHFTQDCK